MSALSRPRLSICGDIAQPPYATIAAALRPLLLRRFPGDPELRFKIMDELDELRIYATGFDLVIQGGLFASGYQLGSTDEAIAFYREISEALAQKGIWHSIEIMQEEADGSWSEAITIP